MTRNPNAGAKKEWIAFTTIVLLTLTLVCYRQFSLFVLDPGESFGGTTLLIKRIDNSEFLDNAKAMCARLQRDRILICKSALLVELARKRSLLELPYSSLLHQISNQGLEFSNMTEHTERHSEHRDQQSRES